MRQPSRNFNMLALMSLLTSMLVIVSPGIANAAELVPALKWSPPATISSYTSDIVTSPTGSVTLPCTANGDGLKQYSVTGQLVQNISRTSTIDGITNCIEDPVVDKNGDTYGVPYGKDSNNTWKFGPNLLAYGGNTLKWKYPVYCQYNAPPAVTVGSDGNIYVATYGRLIGLKPGLATGQTQPDKVLDIAIPNDCSIKLFPYKDGIMLHGQHTGNPQYYSYGGTYLGQAPNGDRSTEKLNANGRLFTYSTISGSNTSISLSAYDPSQGAATWTTSASTPGANTSGGPTLYPMVDGGVAAIITEQKVISGIPASPTQWIQTLVVLNANGYKIRSIELPTTYSNGTAAGTFDSGINIVADNTGKLAIVRGLSFTSPAVRPGIAIDIYDSISGSWFYRQVMTGDFTKPGGASGYALNYSANSVGIASNTVYLSAKCTDNCNDYATKLYAIQTAGLGKDYPKADVLSRTARPSTPYLALGDSFSSGEGMPPFETGTDIPGVNTCHRNANAYAKLIAGTSSKIPSLGAGGFRACSGAVTANITDLQQWNESIQLDWWRDTTTQLVTLTIGGNDIGFADFSKACIFPTSSCDFGTSAYNNSLSKINNELPGKLEATYKRILAYAPNAKIYVLGYPQVVANKSVSDPADSRCFYMQGGSSNWSEARAARDIVTKLNTKISTAITNVRALNPGNTRLRYVPIDVAGSLFIGREVCGTQTTSWFQNIDQATGNPAYVFHPNSLGHQGYATIAAAAINAG